MNSTDALIEFKIKVLKIAALAILIVCVPLYIIWFQDQHRKEIEIPDIEVELIDTFEEDEFDESSAFAFELIDSLNSLKDSTITDIMISGHATAYVGPSDKTCTGKPVRYGICGGCEEYLGKTVILYQRLPDDELGEVIGIYECEDTGIGSQAFQDGRVIDVWKPNKEECQEFMNLVYENDCQGHVWIQVIDAEG